MKLIKKLSLLLVLALAVFGLVACGESTGSNNGNTTKAPTSKVVKTEVENLSVESLDAKLQALSATELEQKVNNLIDAKVDAKELAYEESFAVDLQVNVELPASEEMEAQVYDVRLVLEETAYYAFQVEPMKAAMNVSGKVRLVLPDTLKSLLENLIASSDMPREIALLLVDNLFTKGLFSEAGLQFGFSALLDVNAKKLDLELSKEITDKINAVFEAVKALATGESAIEGLSDIVPVVEQVLTAHTKDSKLSVSLDLELLGVEIDTSATVDTAAMKEELKKSVHEAFTDESFVQGLEGLKQLKPMLEQSGLLEPINTALASSVKLVKSELKDGSNGYKCEADVIALIKAFAPLLNPTAVGAQLSGDINLGDVIIKSDSKLNVKAEAVVKENDVLSASGSADADVKLAVVEEGSSVNISVKGTVSGSIKVATPKFDALNAVPLSEEEIALFGGLMDNGEQYPVEEGEEW